MIGVLTALIGDLASQFGCWVGLKDAVTAISFVALGTSVPGLSSQNHSQTVERIERSWMNYSTILLTDLADCINSYKQRTSKSKRKHLIKAWFSTDTFASKVAAVQDKYADNSIGNVTGSNGVNVFLGIGVAWSMAAIYHAIKGSTWVFHRYSYNSRITIIQSVPKMYQF